MPIASRVLRRLFAVALTTAVAAGLCGPATAATPSVVRTATAATTIPTDCGVVFHRTTGNVLYYGAIVGSRGRAGTLSTLSFDNATQTIRVMAYVRDLSGGEQYLAVLSDGSLWNVVSPGNGAAATTTRVGSGWSGIRELTRGDSGYLYGLTTTGGLVRYTVSVSGVVRGAGTVATAGWSGVRSLTWSGGGTYGGAKVDGFLALTSNGALMEYLVRTADRTPRGFTLRSSGWGSIEKISVGACTSHAGRPIAGLYPDGTLFGYYDSNGYDLRGGDLHGIGQVGRGFAGLKFD